jgi:hypothetical protein
MTHLSFAVAFLLLSACTVGDDAPPDAGPSIADTGPMPDRFMPGEDAGPPPMCEEGATLGDACTGDRECDDRCFCNGVEICAEGVCSAGSSPCAAPECASATCDEGARLCTFAGDDSLCDDGEPCNGPERCDVRSGCRAGAPPTCNDANICTIDYCEAGTGCVFEMIDADGDGAPARTCGGGDCNDADAEVAPTLPETCDNRIDDNCDGRTDIDDPSCAPDNDTCETAAPIDLAGLGTSGLGTLRTRGSTFGFVSNAELSCTGSATDTRRNAVDAVFTFTLAEMRDVTIGVEGLAYDAGILLRDAATCAAGPNLKCSAPSSSTVEPVLHRRRLPAGSYAVIVKTRTAGTFTLALTVEAASAAQWDICVDDMLDVSAGGSFAGALEDHDYALACHTGTSSYAEAVHRLVVPAGEFRDVHLSATVRTPTGTTTTPYLHLTSACGSDAGPVSECDPGTSSVPAELTVRGLPEGTYYVLVETASTVAGVGSYTLMAEVESSSGRPPGDACDAGSPVELVDGTSASFELEPLALDAGPFCSANRPGYRDGFFSFELADERDVLVRTTSTARHWVGVSSTCGTVTSPAACMASLAGTAERRFVRLPAGTHYLDVSTVADTGTVTAQITTFPPTPRPPNDLCAGASPLVDGTPTEVELGPYSDDIVTSCGVVDSTDAFYTFTLETPRFVTLRAEGARAMLLVPDACGATALECAAGGPPQIARVLGAGTYYVAIERLILDPGAVRLRFTTADP